MTRFLAWLFDEKPAQAGAAQTTAANVGHDSQESAGREPHWYEREQLGGGNLTKDGKLNPRVMPPPLP